MKWTGILVAAVVVLCLAAPYILADEDKAEEKKTFVEAVTAQAGIIDKIAPSIVHVEYTLRYDKGEEPSGSGFAYRCPSCGSYHGIDESETIREERPMEVVGYLVADDKVVTPDMALHSRFIKSVAVRYGDRTVPAKIVAWARNQNASLLQLEKPLAGAKALGFQADAKSPYYAVTHSQLDGLWTSNVKSLSAGAYLREDGKRFVAAPSACIIVNEKAVPVALTMTGELPTDDSWKVNPLKWDFYNVEEMADRLKNVEEITQKGILRVVLNFRSPKKTADTYSRYRGDDESKTVRNVLGLVLDDKVLMVLTSLKPKVTARLTRIVAYTQDGKEIPAEFEATLSDYGCFIATLAEPIPQKLQLSDKDITGFLNRVLFAANVRLKGENRNDYYNHQRISGYEIGWKRHLYPEVRGRQEGATFLFDADGKLVAFPIARREKASIQERWSSAEPILTASTDFKELLGTLAEKLSGSGSAKAWTDLIDASNVPLGEEEENRLAWLGVELQPLNKELARANNVSELSRDGSIGALVSYVYPNSPASQADVEVGDILLRLHIEGHPKPLEVVIDQYGSGGRMFPWDRLDEIPEQYYDQIPSPWPSAENIASRTLTDLGFGKKFRAEFVHDGKVVFKDAVVVQSPPHYASAKKYKSKALGLTVKNLTYEVQRYFHKTAKDPGVIVSKIEPGSKSSVAGIKPYEIITHVNGETVMGVKDFEKLVAAGKELRFSVKRMTKGREVRIKLKSAETKPADQDASTQPSGEEDAGE